MALPTFAEAFCVRSRASLQDLQRAGHRGASCRQPASQQAPRPGHHGRRLDRVLPPASNKTAWLGPSSWSAIAGSPPPRSALPAVGPHNRWRWGRGPVRCGVCGLVMDRDRNAAAISPPGPRRQPARSSRPRTASRRPGHQCPRRGGAGHRVSVGETGLDERGSDAPAPAGGKDTREGFLCVKAPRVTGFGRVPRGWRRAAGPGSARGPRRAA